jgi:4a-hydroxytetrahydrobiopterin dehydratase
MIQRAELGKREVLHGAGIHLARKHEPGRGKSRRPAGVICASCLAIAVCVDGTGSTQNRVYSSGRAVMTTDLVAKTCTPCRGGVPPMSREKAKRYIGETPNWLLAAEGTRITRIFRLRDFKAALRFVDKVGAVAEDEGQHPDIRFGWVCCSIEQFTLKMKDLQEKDFIMVVKINALAEE